MKTEQISDSVKIFRLMPFFLGIAIIWSVATVIDTNAFLKMGEMPKGENNSRLIAHFIGFYLGREADIYGVTGAPNNVNGCVGKRYYKSKEMYRSFMS